MEFTGFSVPRDSGNETQRVIQGDSLVSGWSDRQNRGAIRGSRAVVGKLVSQKSSKLHVARELPFADHWSREQRWLGRGGNDHEGRLPPPITLLKEP